MVDLPVKTKLTSGTTTEADFQSAIGDMYDYVGQQNTQGDPEAIDCDAVNGSITPTKTYIQVDTDAGTALTDDLTRIIPTNIGKKQIIIRSTSSGRVVTVKHNISGTGKMVLNGGVDFVLHEAACGADHRDAGNDQCIV